MNISLCDDQAAWNRVVLELSGTLYHSWEWGEVRRAEGWLPSRVLLQADGKAVAAVQILERQLPAGIGTLLYVPRGIAGGDNDPAVVASVVAWLKVFMRERRAILLRMDPGFPDSDETRKVLLVANGLRPLADQWSFWNFPRATMVVGISGSEEDILRKMRRTHRQLIQKILKDGLEIEIGTDIAQLRDFYALVLKSSERQGFALHGKDHFLNIREQFSARGDALFFLCRQNGRAVAAILCGCFGATCHYFHGGFDSGLRVPGATEVLHWKAIQWAKGKGCKRYDLLGTSTPHPPKEGNRGYGLYSYKKGFGAELVYSAGYFELVRREIPYRLLRFAEQHPRLVDTALNMRSFF
ncbi:MAG: lipid II:glycine glycyltransferase FemX [Candidatus Acidiferrales bacterium]